MEGMKAKYDSVILPGNVLMSKASSSEGQRMHITIEDKISGCRVLEIYMSLEEFAKALTASYGEATIEHFPNSPVGKKHEHKTEVVPIPKKDEFHLRNKPERVKELLKPFEVDGWRGNTSDMTNHHCFVPNKGQSVGFHRYVDIEEK